MGFGHDILRRAGAAAVDFALPPRCTGCGAVVGELHAFCSDCWQGITWLGDNGCATCGLPLEATDERQCGRCLAKPPILARTRAAVVYDDTSRALALKLKYGRRVAVARTMGRYMERFAVGIDPDAILVPVPLHRWRLWARGFNQAVLIARALGRRSGHRVAPMTLRRNRATQKLKGMTPRQRAAEVRGAFAAREDVAGKTIILIDDVITTGSTADACAKALTAAGAARVELICFARVVHPARLEI